MLSAQSAPKSASFKKSDSSNYPQDVLKGAKHWCLRDHLETILDYFSTFLSNSLTLTHHGLIKYLAVVIRK